MTITNDGKNYSAPQQYFVYNSKCIHCDEHLNCNLKVGIVCVSLSVFVRVHVLCVFVDQYVYFSVFLRPFEKKIQNIFETFLQMTWRHSISLTSLTFFSFLVSVYVSSTLHEYLLVCSFYSWFVIGIWSHNKYNKNLSFTLPGVLLQ